MIEDLNEKAGVAREGALNHLQSQGLDQLLLEAAGITSGPVFCSVTRHGAVGGSLSTVAVAQVVKTHAKRAGFDPSDFSGHSLRAGFVTSAAEKGATADRIMDHTGHRSVAMVRVYTRRADGFADHAGEGLL